MNFQDFINKYNEFTKANNFNTPVNSVQELKSYEPKTMNRRALKLRKHNRKIARASRRTNR